MSQLPVTHIPSEMDVALETERAKSLRFRFLLYCYVGLGMTPLVLLPTIVRMVKSGSGSALLDLYPLSILLTAAISIAAVWNVHVDRSAQSRKILRIAFWVYVVTCVITLVADRLQPFEHVFSRRGSTLAEAEAATRRAAERRAAAAEGKHEWLEGAVQIGIEPSATRPHRAAGSKPAGKEAQRRADRTAASRPAQRDNTLPPPPTILNEFVNGFVRGAEAAARQQEAREAKLAEEQVAAARGVPTSRGSGGRGSRSVAVDDFDNASGWVWRTPVSIGFIHFVACLFLPWTFRESIKPAFVVAACATSVTLIDVLTGRMPLWAPLVIPMIAPSVIMPGSLICWWRFSRFRRSFSLRYDAGRYHQLRHELEAARQVHESCLPKRLIAGPVRLDYAYEPMRSIGGDLVYMHPRDTWVPGGFGPDVPTTLLVLDVAGHGVAAALTVNRLVGEIERVFGEEPTISPADLLNRLNRYVWLTLSRYGLYVTATAAQIDRASGRLHFASAGHPTAFVRRADGQLLPLESTTYLLGVVEGEDFGRNQIDLTFGVGDSLILYTDGATEARDPSGVMLGTQGLVDLIDTLPAIRPTQPDGMSPGAWSYELLNRVRSHRQAPPDDDTLVVVLSLASDAESDIPSVPHVPVARVVSVNPA